MWKIIANYQSKGASAVMWRDNKMALPVDVTVILGTLFTHDGVFL